MLPDIGLVILKVKNDSLGPCVFVIFHTVSSGTNIAPKLSFYKKRSPFSGEQNYRENKGLCYENHIIRIYERYTELL